MRLAAATISSAILVGRNGSATASPAAFAQTAEPGELPLGELAGAEFHEFDGGGQIAQTLQVF